MTKYGEMGVRASYAMSETPLNHWYDMLDQYELTIKVHVNKFPHQSSSWS